MTLIPASSVRSGDHVSRSLTASTSRVIRTRHAGGTSTLFLWLGGTIEVPSDSLVLKEM